MNELTDRELDAWLAEHLFGMRHRWFAPADFYGTGRDEPLAFYFEYTDGLESWGWFKSGNPSQEAWPLASGSVAPTKTRDGWAISDIARYSSTGDGMLAVLEAMRRNGWGVSITASSVGGFIVEFMRASLDEEPHSVTASAISLSRAVAAAAKRAIEAEAV